MTQLPLFFGTIGMPEIIIIGLIFAFIWGGKKLPELGRGIGGFFKNLKEGVSGDEE